MARFTLNEITTNLQAAITAGMVWNVDYQEIKAHLTHCVDEVLKHGPVDTLDNLLHTENANAYNEFIRTTPEFSVMDDHERAVNWRTIGAAFEKTRPATSQLTAALLSIQNANLTNLLGYATNPSKVPTDPRFDCVRDALNTLRPALEALAAAKPLIVKGRKPTENPSSTMRTIDHTGTCGCCRRNIKMTESGKMWDHGYTIDGRGRGYGASYKNGNSCFGVGFEPIEISKLVWEHMLVRFEAEFKRLPEFIQTTETWLKANAKPHPLKPGEIEPVEAAEYRKRWGSRRMSLLQFKSEYNHLKTAIPELIESIKEWKPKALPGSCPSSQC